MFPEFDLARVTETTARALMPLSAKGKKDEADQLAVDTMRAQLNALDYNFRVVLGEGAKDNAPMLYTGETLGKKKDSASRAIDLVVDPLECTTNFSKGLPDSTSVLLAVEQGHVQFVPGSYMQQLLVPGQASHLLDTQITLDSPVPEILGHVAQSVNRKINELVVVVQDRPRHKELIESIRKEGAGISLVESGSISAAFEVVAGQSKRTQLLWGTFGAPEALIIAFMARQSGFGFLARMVPHDQKTAIETRQLGLENKTLHTRDLVSGDAVLCISGIHASSWLRGVEALTQSNSHRFRVHTLYWKEKTPVVLVHIDGELVEVKAV